jgi:hypothetical protein
MAVPVTESHCTENPLWITNIQQIEQIYASHHYAVKPIVAPYIFTHIAICAIQINAPYMYTQIFGAEFLEGAHGIWINMALQFWHIIIKIILGERKNGH